MSSHLNYIIFCKQILNTTSFFYYNIMKCNSFNLSSSFEVPLFIINFEDVLCS